MCICILCIHNNVYIHVYAHVYHHGGTSLRKVFIEENKNVEINRYIMHNNEDGSNGMNVHNSNI